jgi:DNA segregation ATPase FtsK/SpoIIIE, S-DNA-T family
MNKKMKSRLEKKDKQSKSPNKKKRNNEMEDFSISVEFKKQILGFILVLFGVLLLLSIFSYSPSDEGNISNQSVLSIFKRETSSVPVKNWLGIAGAISADFLITKLCGYFSAIISLIIIFFGFNVIRKKSLFKPVMFGVYSLMLMIVLSSSASILAKYITIHDSPYFSGAVGGYFANITYSIFGSVGSAIFCVILFAVNIFILIDVNIIKTFARIKLIFEKIKDSFKKEKETLVSKAEEKENKKAEKLKAKEEKESSLEEALRKEQERINKAKYGKSSGEEGEEPVIKETEINRPRKEELKLMEEAKAKEEKKPEIKEIELDEKLASKAGKKPVPVETDVNPENSNELDNYDESDEGVPEETLDEFINPSLDLLDNPTKEEFEVIPDEELNHNGKLLQEKLLKFGIEIEKVYATPGPVVTLYELVPAADVKLSKIESLQDDIALAMKAKGIRMIIPIPGKGTVGVEIPNHKAQIVRIKSILSSKRFSEGKERLCVAFGKMIDGEVFIDDLAKMPHVLIAGATGSGKSVGINTLIASLLFKLHPSELKFVMIDPKKIELSLYAKLKKHYLATSVDVNESIITSPSNAVSILKSVEVEMEQRYDRLANAGVRNIEAYNRKFELGEIRKHDVIRHKQMPYVVVIIDELADLMITAKRDIEEPIARIAQMARAVGIHLIVATQRPSVDVITGVIKANFPIRIAYQVASKIDSRTILDMGGADALLRNGDMLYLSASSSKPIRIQNAYISTEECERIVEFIGEQKGYTRPYLLPSIVERRLRTSEAEGDKDPLFKEAAEMVIRLGQCSTSTLQRRLKIGYARAARIVDQMEVSGIVGPNQGAKGREILILEEDLGEYL